MKSYNAAAGKSWQTAIIAVVGIFFVATASSLVVAKLKVSRVMDTEYYSHGLHYAETHSKAGNAGMGWTMTPSVAGGDLQVLVRDEAGQPVTGGRVVYDLDRTAGNRQASGMLLTESSPGIYRIPQTGEARGELHGIMRFIKGEASITGKVVVIN